MASEDSSDSDICYLPPSESNSKGKEPLYSKFEKNSAATSSSSRYGSSSRGDTRRYRSSSRGDTRRYRSSSRGDTRRFRSSSREFKLERRSRSRSSSRGDTRRYRSRSSSLQRIRERRSRRSRLRSYSRESRCSRQSRRNDSGSSSRERQKKYMKYGRRSSSSSESSGHERRQGRNSRRSSSSRGSSGYERNSNYRSSQMKARSSSSESRREDKSNLATNLGKTQRKGEKKTFFCPLCLIELNSEDTMNSHVNGVKHTKKEIEYNQKTIEAAARGIKLPEKNVYQIPNPEATKKKIPIRLHEKIKKSADPVVGLKYIHEFIADSDPEMEPYYECELCGSCGHANMIFGHIMGSRHRQNFAAKIYGKNKCMNMKQVQLLDLARKYNENNDKISSMIRTERNDENYPWPPGKAPWSIEKGGTGKAPINARNWSKSSERKEVDDKTLSRSDVKRTSQVKVNVEKRGSLPPPNNLGPPKNLEDAKKYIDLGSQMIKMAIDSNNSMEASQKMKLKNALENMASEMEQVRRKHERSMN